MEATALGPVQDAVQDAHLGIVPVEAAALGLIHPMLEFDAAPVKSEPVGVIVE